MKRLFQLPMALLAVPLVLFGCINSSSRPALEPESTPRGNESGLKGHKPAQGGTFDELNRYYIRPRSSRVRGVSIVRAWSIGDGVNVQWEQCSPACFSYTVYKLVGGKWYSLHTRFSRTRFGENDQDLVYTDEDVLSGCTYEYAIDISNGDYRSLLSAPVAVTVEGPPSAGGEGRCPGS